MARILLVDGHSAIFSSPDLLAEHRDNQRRARQMLVDRLHLYQGATDRSVVVVFDGKGPEETREGGSEGEALVIYSRRGSSADAVIERLVAAQSGRHAVTVASNDRMILDAAMSSGAEAISVRTLQDEIARTLEAFRGKWGLG